VLASRRSISWSESIVSGLVGATDALAKIATTCLTDYEKNRQLRAVIFAASSQSAARRGQLDRALQDAEQAVRWAPDWLPAFILLAEQQARSGMSRAARRTVEKNWAQHPHPQLASIYRETFEDAAQAIKNVQKLCRANANAFESRMAMAETAFAADIWGEARRYLISLVSSGQATKGVYKLLARLERRESGDEQAAMQWMIKASDAPADAVWQCRSCATHHAEWLATCDACGSFDSVQWQASGALHSNGERPRITHDDYF
jgi:HemY protein